MGHGVFGESSLCRKVNIWIGPGARNVRSNRQEATSGRRTVIGEQQKGGQKRSPRGQRGDKEYKGGSVEENLKRPASESRPTKAKKCKAKN